MSAEQEMFLRPESAETCGLTSPPKGRSACAARRNVDVLPAPPQASPQKVRNGTPSVSAASLRGRALRSVTLRMNPTLVRTLRRAASERSLDFVEPFTQQAIAEAALAQWLQGAGYQLD